MAAMPALNRPTHPGPIGGNLQTCNTSSGPTSQGLHSTSQDPGLPAYLQHPMAPRPLFYVHGPPPPHFLHYQWPMPFSYNPFAGFPGMGYGMVMPPFHPPPPYMEAPAYVLPNTHMQPVDYRRFMPPQVHAHSAPYQNPNQAHRVRLPFMANVRETVNSEVQTEPTRRGAGTYSEESPVVSLDSGRGTASNSPLSSSSEKQGPAEVDNYTVPCSDQNDSQVKETSATRTVKQCFDIHPPKGTTTVQAHINAPLEKQSHEDVVEMVHPCDACSNVWSRSSADGMDPVCRSSKQEAVDLERRDSVPDILMSWGGGTMQTTMLSMAEKLPLNDLSTEVDHVESVNQSPTGTRKSPGVSGGAFANSVEGNFSSGDSTALFKILKMRPAHEARKAEYVGENADWWGMVGSVNCPPKGDEQLQSVSDSIEQDYSNWTNLHEETADIDPYQISLNSGQIKRKMNESVWSVESLAPFIPTKEWLMQNSTFEHQPIIELIEETENGGLSTQNNPVVKAGEEESLTRKYSSCDSDLMSDSWLTFSTPAGKRSLPKKPGTKSKIDALEIKRPKQGHGTDPSDKDSFASHTCLPVSKVELFTATEDVDKNRSSEPEANQGPNQQLLFVNVQQAKTSSPQEQDGMLLLNSAAEEKISSICQIIHQKGVEHLADAAYGYEVSQQRNEKLCIPTADQKLEVSPSKGHLVDCGVQCRLQLEDCNCKKVGHEAGRRDHLKCADKKAVNGQDEGFNKGQYRKKPKKNQWRNRGPEKQSSQTEAYN